MELTGSADVLYEKLHFSNSNIVEKYAAECYLSSYEIYAICEWGAIISMTDCLFVSDLHGRIDRFEKLFVDIRQRTPDGVFVGGDILPPVAVREKKKEIQVDHFITDYLKIRLNDLRNEMLASYPGIFIILGNDDEAIFEKQLLDLQNDEICTYVHNRIIHFGDFSIFGYSFVPPTPFRLKDWERYDVSRYTDPGSISPEEGIYSVEKTGHEKKFSTIKEDLEKLTGDHDLSKSIFLFHSPPYKTMLDMADLEGRNIDHVPLDPHIGSIAIKRFIEERQPLITLHGHAHESAQQTGQWSDKIGKTFCFSAAHNGRELAVINFNPKEPEKATRELI